MESHLCMFGRSIDYSGLLEAFELTADLICGKFSMTVN
jgi:hypothetical protein